MVKWQSLQIRFLWPSLGLSLGSGHFVSIVIGAVLFATPCYLESGWPSLYHWPFFEDSEMPPERCFVFFSTTPPGFKRPNFVPAQTVSVSNQETPVIMFITLLQL
jgi:hypothetical protein